MDDPSSETSLSLLKRVRAGEHDSWERLAFLYSPVVSIWCRESGIPESDIEDIKQEVFQSIFRKIDSFKRVAKYSFRGWLKKITLNRCVDFHRKAPGLPTPSNIVDSITVTYRRIDDSSYFDPSLTPEQINEEKSVLLARVFELIRGEFSNRDIAVFCDYVGHELQPEAVADLHQISKNSVYKIKCKILARIRQEFDDLINLQN